MTPKNILITSISAKIPLIQAVTSSKNKFDKTIKIYGADINDNIIGKYFIDSFWKMPRISLLNVTELITYCKKNHIKYIIPTRDEDVVFLAKHKELLLENKIFAFVSDYSSVLFCFDKLNFYQNNKDKIVIPTYTEIKQVNSKFVVAKERYGAGSKKIAINISKDEAIIFKDSLDCPVFQPYIWGKEYSIDSYVSKEGKQVASITRSRDLIVDGEAKITTRIHNFGLENDIKEFLENNKILGHSVLQVIQQNDKYHIIECNARFGGASTLSFNLGLESFYWFLLECNNQSIQPTISNRQLTQVRISKDIYFES